MWIAPLKTGCNVGIMPLLRYIGRQLIDCQNGEVMSKSVNSIKTLISIREVCSITSFSRSTLWKKVKEGAFPKPVSLSDDGIRKAFVSDEVQAWIDDRISLRDQKDAA